MARPKTEIDVDDIAALITQTLKPLIFTVVGIVVVIYFVVSWALSYDRKEKERKIKISQLNVYPVKGCRGMSVKSWMIEDRGLQYDRQWMIVSRDKGAFQSQRTLPKLALVKANILLKEAMLVLEAPGMTKLSIQIRTNQKLPERTCILWEKKVVGLVIAAGSKWISEFCNKDLDMVVMADNYQRQQDPKYAGPGKSTGYSDEFAHLLIGEASLSDINKRLNRPVEMDRFRPNIVTSNSYAWEEDLWGDIGVNQSVSSAKENGALLLTCVKPCSRCTVTTVDQERGSRSSENQPLRTLRTFRKGRHLGLSNPKWKDEVFVGQNLTHEGLGQINVGDTLYPRRIREHSKTLVKRVFSILFPSLYNRP